MRTAAKPRDNSARRSMAVRESQVTGSIPTSEWRDFQAWCDSEGFLQKAAMRGALGLIRRLPVRTLSMVMRRDWDGVAAWMDKRLSEASA